MKATLMRGAMTATLVLSSLGASAADYCTIPYLYATHIRTSCEQYGTGGLAGLYSSSRFINGMLHTVHKAPATPPPGSLPPR